MTERKYSRMKREAREAAAALRPAVDRTECNDVPRPNPGRRVEASKVRPQPGAVGGWDSSSTSGDGT